MKPATVLLLAALLSTAALPAVAHAEEPAPPAERRASTFRVDYVLVDLEGGRRTHERSYSMTVNGGSVGRLRTGTKVPVDLGDKGVQYIDIGLQISGRVWERDGDVLLDSEIERSSVATSELGAATKGNPILRTVTQSLSSRPTPGKAMVLSTLDDVEGPSRLQVEVTVTRLK